MLYLANPCSPAVTAAMTTEPGAIDGLGDIDTPAQGNARPAGIAWCADNGCYGSGWPGYEAWYAWLTRNAADAPTCLFATAPDVVANAWATEARSRPWLPRVRDLGDPVAYVAQDGMEYSSWDLWDEIDCLFIGGSTEWKLSPEAATLARCAASYGKWVHLGRCNSFKRYAYAWDECHADSVDGTYLTFGPDKNLPNVLNWRRQMEMRARFEQQTLDMSA